MVDRAEGVVLPEMRADGWTATVPELREWARAAAAGSFLYARAGRLPKEIGVEARALAERGIVNLVQRRIAGGFAFIAQRRSGATMRPVIQRKPEVIEERPKAGPPLPPGDTLGREMMVLLRRCANLGEPCPTDRELGLALGLPNADAASYQLRRLREARQIAVSQAGLDLPRVVTILASGKSTFAAKPARATQ